MRIKSLFSTSRFSLAIQIFWLTICGQTIYGQTIQTKSSEVKTEPTASTLDSGSTMLDSSNKTDTPPEQEIVVEVRANRHLIQSTGTSSSVQINKKVIQQLPQGDQISLSKLISTTTPGVVQGAFGQLFIRGNHANIQYRIDGVQLPESSSSSLGEAFSPRNIDHMEIITGGIPAEYGERLAAVVNIVTKTGPESPGGSAELNYGTYNRFSPQLVYGGSNESGNLHYYLSANYFQTDRGLDSPQPVSTTDQSQGGRELVHNEANGNNEFLKMDWIADNDNKLSFSIFNSANSNQIPNYPSSFSPTDAFFTNTDAFGNSGFNYLPPNTNDTQFEVSDYFQTAWKHTFSTQTFLQMATFWKYSQLEIGNDLPNDLSPLNPNQANAASLAENRHVNNIGLKADLTTRLNDQHLAKMGIQLLASQGTGTVSVWTVAANSTNSDPNTGYFVNAYLQDDYSISPSLTLNAGIRVSATEFLFSGITSSDYLVQPRLGLSYLLTNLTKLHLFYGKLFMPAPVEDLRVTFSNLSPTTPLTPYDIKAEKDDFFEFGVSQQLGGTQLATLNTYYKNATNMLDDTQLLNTSLTQPYNFSTGFAYGVELSVRGQISEDWSEYANYSYEIAKGQGISGGLFAFPSGQGPSTDYQFLDHVQIHTFNSGLTYSKNHFWGTLQGLFGSGLRTGPGNSNTLPAHFTCDSTFGYELTGKPWISNWKLSLDILNLFDNAYPITIANGFNGSHYSAGRVFFVHLTKIL